MFKEQIPSQVEHKRKIIIQGSKPKLSLRSETSNFKSVASKEELDKNLEGVNKSFGARTGSIVVIKYRVSILSNE